MSKELLKCMERVIFLSLFFLFFKASLCGLVVGNPSNPGLYLNGIFSSNKKNFSFRASYLYNYIYKGRFQENLQSVESSSSDIKLRLIASIITFNICNRLDLYGIFGTTNFQLDQMIYTNRRFAWGIGTKSIIFKIKKLDFSLDAKYFETTQKPQYFVVEKDVYPLASSFEQKLEEYQASFSISYLTDLLIPYIGSTFLYSIIKPTPKGGFIIIPGGGKLFFETFDSVTRKKWGMVLGISIINKKNQANINIESRVFDQNAFAFVGTFRF